MGSEFGFLSVENRVVARLVEGRKVPGITVATEGAGGSVRRVPVPPLSVPGTDPCYPCLIRCSYPLFGSLDNYSFMCRDSVLFPLSVKRGLAFSTDLMCVPFEIKNVWSLGVHGTVLA